MLVIEAGHIYNMKEVPWGMKHAGEQQIRFRNAEPGKETAGITTQDILRVLIDRTRYCNNCLPHPVNERIIKHLQMALVLHEARALERKTLKGELRPEDITTAADGHFMLPFGENVGETTRALDPVVDPEKLTPSYLTVEEADRDD